jgi:nicotinamide mononucleotide (NMN) deamidase PncC
MPLPERASFPTRVTNRQRHIIPAISPAGKKQHPAPMLHTFRAYRSYTITCHLTSIPTRSFLSLARSMATSSSTSEFPPPSLATLLTEVSGLLKERKETVGVAETAAGGLISASLLSTPGASGIYAGGLTLYTLPSRLAFGGWTEENVKAYKGPTPSVVAGLAEHTREKLGSTYQVCESGTAGPTGGSTRNRTP